ncbi:allantoate amidohydrolase [Novosphingobium flavum]|uniref:Allantoate amidohydrolase n=1 Tax=Novosphingobium flavum TaxID=1778672 RepID=A0A7X1FQR4_9SPHN|nr:allantoate amidohydrolase [Novosphingobium flavum]MBC2665245.1 allantoate amidohydrolase [Novosphingobium flavum]
MVSGGTRAVARCDELGAAPYSDSAEGLTRTYLSPAYLAAQDRLALWMEQAGMSVRRDPAMNLVGRYEGTDPAAPILLIGSHLDSVIDAGRYDGPLGIMLGVEAVAALSSAGQRLPFAIEVIAFGDEEGSRFPAAMLTSRAVAGTLDPAALALRDGAGVALADLVDIAAYPSAARAPGSIFAYLEAHIEQGPVLEDKGLALGTVTGIAAQLRYQVTLSGMAGHAGTTSMPLRRDALAGAAEAILAAERIARDDQSDLVATVGRIEALPGAANVIPGEARFTLDVRSGDEARRDRGAEAILDAIAQVAERRGLDFVITRIHDLPASPCDGALMDLMDAALAEAGHPPFRLVSGAGHDAMNMAALCPTAMLFLRCRAGISHNPAEHVEPADAEAALQVMLGFIDRLGAMRAA